LKFQKKSPYIRIWLNWNRGIIREAMQSMIQLQSGWEIITDPIGNSEFADVCISHDMPVQLSGHENSIPLVICSQFKKRSEIQKALEMGAKGCVSTDSTWDDLVRCVNQAIQGRSYLCHTLAKMMCSPMYGLSSVEDEHPITPREKEILKLIVQGRTSKEIGKILLMSPNTVETHRRNIKQKAGCHKAAELAVFALRLSIVT
jgi:DNA-binding NarL/FixJ family response regulator